MVLVSGRKEECGVQVQEAPPEGGRERLAEELATQPNMKQEM